ncbi:MAG: hypothetical protein Q4A64_08855 [Porphyromonadaceae bacterium]|nr:hypothetical protein [Porphyromonadaceae bacterium]
MKKLMIPILTGLLLVQCTSSTDEPKVLNQETKVQASHPYERSLEEALGAVQEFLSQESELRGFTATRTIDRIVHLENVSELRSTEGMADLSNKFYAVELMAMAGQRTRDSLMSFLNTPNASLL